MSSKKLPPKDQKKKTQKISTRKYYWKSLSWPTAYATRFPLAEHWEQMLHKYAFDKSVL